MNHEMKVCWVTGHLATHVYYIDGSIAPPTWQALMLTSAPNLKTNSDLCCYN